MPDPGSKLELDKENLEEALRNALRSVVGGLGPGINPRVGFHNIFQREMEEHDRDFEKKYDEDLNTTLIFSGLFSAVTSAFIIDVQSELKPDYEQMNNTLLEMLLKATTGTLPPDSAASVPRWTGPDPVIVQVQCVFYAALSATLLASFLAMLGKQWLNRYGRNETRGSTADRSRVRERKLTGIETWKFDFVMESLPLILQFALLLLGFALSRYLWEVNRSASSVVIGFTSFGLLFYLLIVTASVFSFDCPFQTPVSLLVRFVIGLTLPYWQTLRKALGPKEQPPEPKTPAVPHDLPFSADAVGRGHELMASITTIACIAPGAIQFPWSVPPRFIQERGAEGDRLDARCIARLLTMSADADVVTSIMDFIPEVVWHSGIKNVPLKPIYEILMDCFDFSGPHPAVIPKLRDVAYRSAKAFAHIALQRRCITQHEEQKLESWVALSANHPLLSLPDYDTDPDFKAVLYMVDLTLGHQYPLPWGELEMTTLHHAWMSHALLYHAWHEGELSEVVMDFVENSVSIESPSDIVIADCLFMIGLMIGVPFHVNDIIVRDKSREKKAILREIFRAFSAIFSGSIQMQSALRALRFVAQLGTRDIVDASYELFEKIMTPQDLTDQHWEAARLALRGSSSKKLREEPREIIRFLDYHLRLQGEGEDHGSSIELAWDALTLCGCHNFQVDHLAAKCIRDFNCASPPFVKGVQSIMHPSNAFGTRFSTVGLIATISDQWFNSPTPVMEPREMPGFCEHLAVFMIDDARHRPFIQRCGATILFGLLRSPEWRKHIVARLWSLLAYCTLVEEDLESFRWCLENAIELLEFTKGLPDGEGLKWWYGVLWFHYHKLDTTVRGEVERIAREMSLGDGVTDLHLYLELIGQEVARTRREVERLANEDKGGSCMALRPQLLSLEGNQRRLTHIING